MLGLFCFKGIAAAGGTAPVPDAFPRWECNAIRTPILDPTALTADELSGRMIVLEAMAMVALGGAIRPITEAATPDKFVRVLNGVKRAVQIRIQEEQESGALSPDGGAEAIHYLDLVLSMFSESLIPRGAARN